MFSRRRISLRFQLDLNEFNEGGDIVDVTGVRCSANITHAGATLSSTLDLRVWGMSMSLMNELSIINKLAYHELGNNIVTVLAGDDESGVAVVFQGTVTEAWVDGRDPPDMMFHVAATSAAYDGLKAVAPTSYRGTVDVATVLSGIAVQMNLTLHNNGVTCSIIDPYWPGSLSDQLRKIAELAHVEYFIDTANRTLEVWQRGKARTGDIVLVSPQTGLVGYPSFSQSGVQFTTLYNPSIVFGGVVDIQSAFTPANGPKAVATVSHNLDCEIPGGRWFSEVECSLLEIGLLR